MCFVCFTFVNIVPCFIYVFGALEWDRHCLHYTRPSIVASMLMSPNVNGPNIGNDWQRVVKSFSPTNLYSPNENGKGMQIIYLGAVGLFIRDNTGIVIN